MAGGAAPWKLQAMSMPSMRCGECNILVRSIEGVQEHSVKTSHCNRWGFTDVALRGLICAVCDEQCGSERVADAHTKKFGHMEFKMPGSNQKKLVELVPAEVDNEVLKLLTSMGYSQASATRALCNCGTKDVDQLTSWLTDHKDDPNIDTFPMVHATAASDEWFNIVTDEMKVRSRKLRMESTRRNLQRKGAQATESCSVLTTKGSCG